MRTVRCNRRSRPGGRSGAPKRAALLLIGGWPIAAATVVVAMILAGLLLFPMEYGATYDGLVYAPGAVTVGLLIGLIAVARLSPARPVPIAAAVADLGHPPPEAV